MVASDWELNLNKEAFLSDHWQRKPLLIRNAISNFVAPLDSNELAGLALEDEIESRIIETLGTQRNSTEKNSTEVKDTTWQLHHGPFSAEDFQRDCPWTLLIQAVDHYIPQVAALRKLVDFIPQWRVDDVMASYATDGGSVGPHYDNYDVFLLQGEGQRLWRVGQLCDQHSPLLDHDQLRILKEFECTQEYLLGPGDMLYIPPGVAHWGIARGECTTFSIGFRAPRLNDMVSRFSDQLLDQLSPDAFYQDPELRGAERAGEIRPQDLERVSAQIQAALKSAGVNRWFGELVTEPRYEQQQDEEELAQARELLLDGTANLELNPAAKLAWQQEPDGIAVYANGQYRLFDQSILSILEKLCGQWRLDAADLATAMASAEGAQLLDYLLECGCIYVE